MEKKENKEAENVQGTERRQGAMSVLKSWKTLLKNLENSGLVKKEDFKVQKEMYSKALKQYIGEDLL